MPAISIKNINKTYIDHITVKRCDLSEPGIFVKISSPHFRIGTVIFSPFRDPSGEGKVDNTHKVFYGICLQALRQCLFPQLIRPVHCQFEYGLSHDIFGLLQSELVI